MKPIETTFKRIETKYVVSKEILEQIDSRFKGIFSRRRLSNFNNIKYLL